jgi:hypothetical protein
MLWRMMDPIPRNGPETGLPGNLCFQEGNWAQAET